MKNTYDSEYQRKYHQQRREILLKMHICVYCGKNDACKGETICVECKEKKREYDARHKESASIQAKERRERLKAEGICVQCGKNEAVPGYTLCSTCKSKNKYRMRRHRRRNHGGLYRCERPDYGFCYQCGRNELVPGMRICPSCYEKLQKPLKKARDANRQKNEKRKERLGITGGGVPNGIRQQSV